MIEKIFEKITNNFYTTEPVIVKIVDQGFRADYYENKITISRPIMDAFYEANLPRFSIYYHELAHHLYSAGMFMHEEKWRKISSGPLEWKDKYHHLINWIEDYYIEATLLKQYPYLSDTINCLKLLIPEYNPQHLKYIFNHYYLYGVPNNALSYDDQLTFVSYIDKLLKLRRHPLFGEGVVSNLKIKPGRDTLYAYTLVEFYDWCVTKGIFEPEQELPPLTHPTSFITTTLGLTDDDINYVDGDNGPQRGASDDHSDTVGVIPKENFLSKSDKVTDRQLELEQSIINREILDMTQVFQSDERSRDIIFSPGWKPSFIIQPKVNIKNFFNPKCLLSQDLFLERKHTYLEVSIFRDISGSVTPRIHRLMGDVIELLMNDIPIDVNYYLYASGEISILNVPYVPWFTLDDVPQIYKDNELFQQLGNGTNSDAIADVITQQLNDKHLNIIVTDGDLWELMKRDNIAALLKNVYVIGVKGDPQTPYVAIDSEEDLPKVLKGLDMYERL